VRDRLGDYEIADSVIKTGGFEASRYQRTSPAERRPQTGARLRIFFCSGSFLVMFSLEHKNRGAKRREAIFRIGSDTGPIDQKTFDCYGYWMAKNEIEPSGISKCVDEAITKFVLKSSTDDGGEKDRTNNFNIRDFRMVVRKKCSNVIGNRWICPFVTSSGYVQIIDIEYCKAEGRSTLKGSVYCALFGPDESQVPRARAYLLAKNHELYSVLKVAEFFDCVYGLTFDLPDAEKLPTGFVRRHLDALFRISDSHADYAEKLGGLELRGIADMQIAVSGVQLIPERLKAYVRLSE
jgi:hypothetical protein